MKKVVIFIAILIPVIFITLAFTGMKSHGKVAAQSALTDFYYANDFYDKNGSFGTTQGSCDKAKTIFTGQIKTDLSAVQAGVLETLNFATAINKAEEILGEQAVCYADNDKFALSIKYTNRLYYCIDNNNERSKYSHEASSNQKIRFGMTTKKLMRSKCEIKNDE